MWAVGVVLYELMMLRHPFSAPSIQQLLIKIISGQFIAIPPKLYSAELRSILSSLLAKDPARRPSCNQLLAVYSAISCLYASYHHPLNMSINGL
jgi:serine/threonine protein kinase